MITMPFNNDDEPMGDNYDYGYFPDDMEFGELVMGDNVDGNYV